MSERYQKGWEIIKELGGEYSVRLMKEVEKKAPNLAKLAVEFGYCDVYSNQTLNLKQRALITLSCLISGGESETALSYHFRAALNLGYTKEEILELITHVAAYAGFPKAINAAGVFDKVVQELENENTK